MSKFSTRAESPARSILNEANAARAGVNETVAGTRASLARLAAAKSAPGAIEAELSALDSIETAAMAEWSRSPDDAPMPQPDAGRRETLERSLRSARSAASAATSAEAILTAEQTREVAKLAGIEAHARAATAVIILESSALLLDEMIDAAKALQARAVALEIAREMALTTIESVGDMAIARDGHLALEKFSERFVLARSAWPTDVEKAAAARNAWQQLAIDLRDDSGAQVGAKAVR